MKLHEFFDSPDKWCQMFHGKTADGKPRLLRDITDIAVNDVTRFDIVGAMHHLKYTKKQRERISQAIENATGIPPLNFNDQCKSFTEFIETLKKLDI